MPELHGLKTSRRALAAAAAVAALAQYGSVARAASAPTPAATADPRLSSLIAASRQLCGGGEFDEGQAAMLLNLLSADAALRPGLETILANPTGTVATTTPTSGEPRAKAEEAILIYWYIGYFHGQPVADRAQNYGQLLAWQAMYTPAWTTCRDFGAWADPPSAKPQVPENH